MNSIQASAVLDELQQETQQPSLFSKTISSIKEFSTISQIFRITGAAVIVASLSMFLLQGWDIGNDVTRYWLLLAQTVLLTAGGFAMSYGLKENKGARMFFGLALGSVTANFTILGALIYSVAPLDHQLLSYPAFASWQATGVMSLLGLSSTLAGALLVLVPISIFGMLLMSRTGAKHLTLPFLVINALLLIPLRDGLFAGVLFCGALLLAIVSTMRLPRNQIDLRTPSAKFATALLFVPALIILTRAVCFYDVGASLVLVIGLSIFITLRQSSLMLGADSVIRSVLELLSVLPAFIIGVSGYTLMQDAFTSALPLGICTTIVAAFVFEVARRSQKYDSLLLHIAATALLSGCLFNLAETVSLTNSLICLFAGGATLMIGQAKQQALISVAGVVTILLSAATAMMLIVDRIDLGSWSSLAIIGTLAIVLGSVLERHGATLKLRARNWLRVTTRNSEN